MTQIFKDISLTTHMSLGGRLCWISHCDVKYLPNYQKFDVSNSKSHGSSSSSADGTQVSSESPVKPAYLEGHGDGSFLKWEAVKFTSSGIAYSQGAVEN